MKPTRFFASVQFIAWLCSTALWPSPMQAEYHSFNNAAGVQATVQEVRWPYWAESTYNAIYSQYISGAGGASVYFYGGVPMASPGYPAIGTAADIIWSFWPPSGTGGKAVKAYYTISNMYAPPHIGEGASGKVDGRWPILHTNRWYRFAFRLWTPADGTPNVGYAGKWLRDPVTGFWHHYATMELPFTPTGLDGLGGFLEDFWYGNRNPRRTDYRNVYYLRNNAWESANQFRPSVRQVGEKGNAALIEGGTAAYFETCSAAGYTGNLNFDTGPTAITLTINQPTSPPLDPLVVNSAGAVTHGSQLLVHWQLPATSSPQFAYHIEVFDNPEFTGPPAVSFYDRDPPARQKLLNISGVATPHVRLTISDIFNQTNASIAITPTPVTPVASTSVPDAVGGLGYKYYHGTWTTMPNFNALSSTREGASAFPDLTPRTRRTAYGFNYTGYLEVPATGLYTFTLRSADGSRLYLNDQLVVDHNGVHSPADKSGWVALAAGKHAINLQYFFNSQVAKAGDDIDQLKLAYAGPGIPLTEVPVPAYTRLPGAGEPQITLVTPEDVTTLPAGHVPLLVNVSSNGATINRVMFYAGDHFWGQVTTPPYAVDAFFWTATSNRLRARVVYNNNRTIDSALHHVTTTAEPVEPWTLAGASEHVQSFGAKREQGRSYLVGDGLNILYRAVDGDCTLIARVADILPSSAGPDGKSPGSAWHAGIILRQSLTPTPGTPLGNSTHRYAAVFATVNNGTRYQDHTMANAGGPFWSSNLGSQRWLRLQRAGSVFTTSVSTDGVNWTPVNTNTLTGVPVRMYAGVFTYAAPSENVNVHRATFDNVALTGNIVGPPEVSVTPSSATAYTGQQVVLAALASGAPPLTYRWYYHGEELPGQTLSTLPLTHVQPTNSGRYSVLVSNVHGTATAETRVTVLTPAGLIATVQSLAPVGYWRLEETAGPTLMDSAGAFHGTGEGALGYGVSGAGGPVFTGFAADNRAAQFNGSDTAVTLPPLNLNTEAMTITCWLKRSGAQTSYAGIVFSRGEGTIAGLNFGTANELRYHWNDGGWSWNSGLVVPDNLWTFAALVVEPNRTRIFMATNSTLQVRTNDLANAEQSFSGLTHFGHDPSQSIRRFNGTLDDVAIFNRALTPAELSALLDVSLGLAHSTPAIQLTSPAEGTVANPPATFHLAATVTPNGHTIDRVQFFNGAQLLGEVTNAPYVLEWSDVPTGSYTVLAQAVYDGGSVMSSVPVQIEVSPPVSITTQPQSRTNYATTTATFSVTASRSPVTYQWQFAGADLPGATNATLSLPNLQTSQAGVYRAVVSDGGSSATSGVAVLTVLAVLPGSYVEAIVTNTPVACWRLGEQVGTTAFDHLGGNHGVYNNVVLNQFGALPTDPNRAAYFNGTSASVGTGVSLANNRSAFTMEGWFRLNAAPTAMGFWGQNDALEFGLINSTTLHCWTAGGGAVSVPYAWGTGIWRHLAVVGDGTALRVYVDGQLAGTGGSPTSDYGASAFPFNIGGGGIWGPTGNWFTGWLDEVAFYDKPLPAEEVRRHYLLGLPLPVVTLTQPTNGAIFLPLAGILLAANVVSNGHAVTDVRFYNGSTLLHTQFNPPYAYAWNDVPAGSASLRVVANYETGSVTSSVVNVTIWDSTPPELQLTRTDAGLELTLNGIVGQHYRIEWASELPPLPPWQVVTDLLSLAESPFTLLVATTNDQRYFRAVSIP